MNFWEVIVLCAACAWVGFSFGEVSGLRTARKMIEEAFSDSEGGRE